MPERAHALVRLGMATLVLAGVGSVVAGDRATALICFYFAVHVFLVASAEPMDLRRFLRSNGWLNVVCAAVAVLCSLWAQATLYAAAGACLLIYFRPRS